MKIRALVLVLFLAGSFPLAASASGFSGKTLVFASSYQVAKPVANDILNLGYVTLQADHKAKVSRYLYKAADNLKPHDLNGHVPKMTAPYGTGKCKDRTMQAATPQAFVVEEGEWKESGQDELLLLFAGVNYRWGNDAAAPNALRLLSASDGQGRPFAFAVGYAFLTDQLDHGKRLAKSDLAERFDGDIFHKNTLMSAADGWEASRSSLAISLFKTQPRDPDLAEFSKEGQAAVQQRLKSDLWAHNALVLNADEKSKLMIYQDYGHDFNKNGCYDEQGHDKILMGVPQSGQKINELVYVEYTYDKLDGYPMLSVGRYYSIAK